MQEQQAAELRPRDKDYVPIVQRACDKVKGFSELYKELERSISISGKSQSALINYSRQLAHLALHYNCSPMDLEHDQVMDFLHLVKSQGTESASFFKFTVHGMRYACKMRGLDYSQFSLPEIKGSKKLPVVLNGSEVKTLFKTCKTLRHRLIIGLLYGCGLRSSELQNLKPCDADLERGMLHIRQGKGSKDRYLPLGNMLCRGIGQYMTECTPGEYLFVSNPGEPITRAGVYWIVKDAAKRCKITKHIYPHTLRHSYATHLLEQGVNILNIKELLGHAYIQSTMVYLHIAQPMDRIIVNPLDTLYAQS